MCAHYNDAQLEIFEENFKAMPPETRGKHDVWPGYAATFIRRHEHADVGDDAVPDREAITGIFGLIPHWAKDMKFSKKTYNARSETVMDLPSYRDAWRSAQHCIIPAEAIYEPDWRSGKAISTRIERADGSPMGLAGLWSRWKASDGQIIYSYTMLTINADDHPFYKQFHKPNEEKRMVVVLPENSYTDWLSAPARDSMDFMRQYPAERFTVVSGSAVQ